MKNTNILLMALAIAFIVVSCDDDDDTCTETTWYADADGDMLGDPDSTTMACSRPAGFVANNTDDNDNLADGVGSVTVRFDNIINDEELALVDYESTESFPFTNSLNQSFNIDLVKYYISEIKLIGMGDTEDYADLVSATAEAATGFYHVEESVSSSQMIELANVPDGMYNQVQFTLGVRGDIVEEGALGGVLDPANGAWFWNWNVGYIAFALEGNSPDVGSEDGSHMAFHIGGWSDPNNVKQISLDLPHHLIVQDGSSSMTHVQVDMMDVVNGDANVDFSTTFAVHSPGAGVEIANNLPNAFKVHHVQNN